MGRGGKGKSIKGGWRRGRGRGATRRGGGVIHLNLLSHTPPFHPFHPIPFLSLFILIRKGKEEEGEGEGSERVKEGISEGQEAKEREGEGQVTQEESRKSTDLTPHI